MKIVFVYCYDGWFIYCEEIKGCEFNGGVVQLGQKGGYLQENNMFSYCSICVKDKEIFLELILIYLNFNFMLLFLFKVLDV